MPGEPFYGNVKKIVDVNWDLIRRVVCQLGNAKWLRRHCDRGLGHVVDCNLICISFASDDAADIKANDARVGEDDLDAKAVQAGENLAFIAKNTEQASDARREPLYALECENNELKNQLRNLNLELSHCRGTVDALQNERQMLRKQLVSQLPVQQARPLPLSAAASMAGISGFCSPINRVSSPVVVEEGPVCKVAERVRIKRLDARDKLLTGSEIANLGVSFFFLLSFLFTDLVDSLQFKVGFPSAIYLYLSTFIFV